MYCMRYGEIWEGQFLCRPNRFIAYVDIHGKKTEVHVKNTGRCRELLTEGATVYLEKSENPNRKTAFDLVAVVKGNKIINMDSQAPNRIFAEFAKQFLPTATTIHSEYCYGKSRLDFCAETPEGLHFVEVKGVTLEKDGHACFPNAPTERGIRHLMELERAVAEGHRATVFFVIQMADVLDFSPNDNTHPAFGSALRKAAKNGVQIAAYNCIVSNNSIEMFQPIPIRLYKSIERRCDFFF